MNHPNYKCMKNKAISHVSIILHTIRIENAHSEKVSPHCTWYVLWTSNALCFTRCSIILPKFVTAIRKTSGRLRYNLVLAHSKWSKNLFETASLFNDSPYSFISILLRMKYQSVSVEFVEV